MSGLRLQTNDGIIHFCHEKLPEIGEHMILVQLNKEKGFEYDIHSLVKAFYPPENVSVYAGEKKILQPVCLWMYLSYETDAIEILLKEPFGTAETIRKEGKGRQEYVYDFDLWKIVQKIKFTINYNNSREVRNILKQNLYNLLKNYSDKELPWGTLTGIRPVKIPMSMLEENRSEAEIRDYMMQIYYITKEKADLGIEIAKRELKLLSRLDYKNGYSLYIGIPFCPSTCLYCSFTSYSVHKWKDKIDDYLDALEKEIEFTADYFADKYLNTIYIGGGTPTTLTPEQLERIISKIECCFDLSYLLEFTVEAGRPDSITREKCAVLRKHGISRISINPQTMKQETLNLIGRNHTVEQTIECFHMARSFGFENINMDIIMGLPQETLSDVQHTMQILKELNPDNITIHSLAIKRAARLNMFKEDYADLEMINTQAHLDAAARVCSEMGMHPYYLYRQKNMAGNFENIGYAKEGKAGMYNVLIMEEKQPIAACGAGGISKRLYPDGNIDRSENVKEAALYIEKIDEMIERKRKLFVGL